MLDETRRANICLQIEKLCGVRQSMIPGIYCRMQLVLSNSIPGIRLSNPRILGLISSKKNWKTAKKFGKRQKDTLTEFVRTVPSAA